ncbi:hypothetical protein [Gilvimarinus agarilyticus]|uniref:hypothetical protein n=1 Tax=Gilvimarinus agarilyticus TaxID=679259 RepID=UPI0012F942DB|nr:hypothetical protein [Gilvimarinus agarilyticus]
MAHSIAGNEANKRQLTEDQQALLTWFVLNKLGIATKAGRVDRADDDALIVLFGSEAQVYQRQYLPSTAGNTTRWSL